MDHSCTGSRRADRDLARGPVRDAFSSGRRRRKGTVLKTGRNCAGEGNFRELRTAQPFLTLHSLGMRSYRLGGFERERVLA